MNDARLQFTPLQRAYLTLISLHKPLGVVILALAVLRLIIRWRCGVPPLPSDMPAPMKLAARLSHVLFYLLMLAMPLIGWAMLSAADYPVVVGGIHLPAILSPNAELHIMLWDTHRILAFCAAALFHALVRRDGVFDAMAPFPVHPQSDIGIAARRRD